VQSPSALNSVIGAWRRIHRIPPEEENHVSHMKDHNSLLHDTYLIKERT